MTKILKLCRMYPYQDFSNFGFNEYFPSLFNSSTFFYFFNASKAMLQLILTLGFSWLHVYMISWLVLISLNRKIHIKNIYIYIYIYICVCVCVCVYEISFKLIYFQIWIYCVGVKNMHVDELNVTISWTQAFI